MQDTFSLTPLMRRSVFNDESTITSNLTMNTRMNVVETIWVILIHRLVIWAICCLHSFKKCGRVINLPLIKQIMKIVLRSSRIHPSTDHQNDAVGPQWVICCQTLSPWWEGTVMYGSRWRESLGWFLWRTLRFESGLSKYTIVSKWYYTS